MNDRYAIWMFDESWDALARERLGTQDQAVVSVQFSARKRRVEAKPQPERIKHRELELA